MGELAQVARNGWEIADVIEEERQVRLAEITRVETAFTNV